MITWVTGGLPLQSPLSRQADVVSATSNQLHPPPTFLPIFIFEWRTAKMETAGFAHFELQKSSSETYGWCHGHYVHFWILHLHPCTQPFQLLTLLMCQINHFQLESNVTILKLGMQKVSYLRHARRQKLFFHKQNRNCSPDAYPSLLRAIPLYIPKAF